MKFNSSLMLVSIFPYSCSSSRIIRKKETPQNRQTPTVKTVYDRKHWKHWSDADNDCLNTRSEILQSRSLIPVTLNKKGCTVKTGKWKDYYYPEMLTLASEVDIDHLVPLKYAHDHGAASWSKVAKERFANDPENLVITNKSYNRKKGAKGIDQWLPRHKEYACKYIGAWLKIKKKYSLEVTQAERYTIQEANCL